MDSFDAPTPPSRVPPGGWEAEERRLELQRDIARMKRSRARWLVLALIVLCLVLGWALQWQVVETHTGDRPAAIFMVNRWTGEMRYVQGEGWLAIKQVK